MVAFDKLVRGEVAGIGEPVPLREQLLVVRVRRDRDPSIHFEVTEIAPSPAFTSTACPTRQAAPLP